jgi:hypothetical protein
MINMDMKKVMKMDIAELEELKLKNDIEKVKLQQVIGIINKRLGIVRDDLILGEKPSFNSKKLESDKAEAESILFEFDKFERMLPDLKNNIMNKQSQVRSEQIYKDFLAGLVEVAKAELDGKPLPEEALEKVVAGSKIIPVKKFMRKLQFVG